MNITNEMWASAILGAVVSAVFAGTIGLMYRIYRMLRRLFCVRRLLGPIFDGSPVAIFSNRLYSENRTYLSDQPNYFPPRTQGQTNTHPNIPYVVGTAQMEAVADILHLFGLVRRKGSVNYLSADTDWNIWDQHLFAIGGSHKTDAIFSSCEPRLVKLVPNEIDGINTLCFNLANSDEFFTAINGNDYGLILKATYPPTGVQCFVIMGLGSLGTEAAAYYLRNNAAKLGRAFGGRSFAALVHCRLEQGKQSARLYRWRPIPAFLRVIRHPSLWTEYRRMKNVEHGAVVDSQG